VTAAHLLLAQPGQQLHVRGAVGDQHLRRAPRDIEVEVNIEVEDQV
jgi:hypothetical protein